MPIPDWEVVGTNKSRNTKNHSIQKNQGGGYILKSGCAKKYAFQKILGQGGKGDLEKSRFDLVFLFGIVPQQEKIYFEISNGVIKT